MYYNKNQKFILKNRNEKKRPFDMSSTSMSIE